MASQPRRLLMFLNVFERPIAFGFVRFGRPTGAMNIVSEFADLGGEDITAPATPIERYKKPG
jgi:hypothetical protein